MLEKLGKRLRQEQDFRAQLAGAKLRDSGRRLTDKELFARAGIIPRRMQ